MNDLTQVNAAVYRERLEQALRVMRGLSDTERTNLDVEVFAVETPAGIKACIAGFCGFDPWFQQQGFRTCVGGAIGSVTLSPLEFFGTERPFFPGHYRGRGDQPPSNVPISYDEAVDALKTAIREFADEPRQQPRGENEPELIGDPA